ncbi:hypothetical protein CVT24_003892 [Panaeolus cyanescens]|uniref:F-box domain-containing protein n=1 Tax=Panaeolus cyanescens TaxID=181874 RepID=A0A409VV77_9AGAR|nr:hypothetical protein CVT24_003892 [Panaeolus cyanescens]
MPFLRYRRLFFTERSTKRSPELPYEIWRIIYFLVPKEYRFSLYAVNSTLFNIAMDEEYSSLLAGFVEGHGTLRCIANLSPIVAKRVKSLVLCSGFFDRHIQDIKEHRLSFWIRNAVLLSTHLRNMSGLSKLKLHSYHARYNHSHLMLKLLRLNGAPWTALSVLELEGALNEFPRILDAMPVLRRLEVLSLTMLEPWTKLSVEDRRSFSTKVAQFVNQKCNTITRLEVDFIYDLVALDQFFTSLKPLARLSFLDLVFPGPHGFEEPHDLMGFHGFLAAHTDALNDLTLMMDFDQIGCKRKVVYTGPIQIPNVFNSIRDCIFIDHNPNGFANTLDQYVSIITSFLGQHTLFGCKLTRLQIINHVLRPKDLLTIIPLLGGDASSLRFLKITLLCFQCDLFQLFSSNLPRLETLCLLFSSFSKDRFEDTDDVADGLSTLSTRLILAYPGDDEFDRITSFFGGYFSDKLERQDYSHWGLSSLQWQFYNRHWLPRHSIGLPDTETYPFCAPIYNSFKESIIKAIPSLSSFNGEDIERS